MERVVIFSDILKGQYKLIALPEEILKKLNDEEDKEKVFMEIRGSNTEEEAVLCTKSESYTIQSVETCDMILLGQLCGDRIEVEGILRSSYELNRSKPQLEVLADYLKSRELNIGDDETQFYFTLKGIRDTICTQTSELELLNFIELNRAYNYRKGSYVKLSAEYENLLVDMIIAIIVENFAILDLSSVYLSDILEGLTELEGYHEHAVIHVLGSIIGDTTPEETEIFKIDRAKLSIARAHQIGSMNRSSWIKTEFLEVWKESVLPGSEDLDYSVLEGIYLEDTIGGIPTLQYFPERELSYNVEKRLDQVCCETDIYFSINHLNRCFLVRKA